MQELRSHNEHAVKTTSYYYNKSIYPSQWTDI